MAPHTTSTPTNVLYEEDELDATNLKNLDEADNEKPYKIELVWRNIIIAIYLHLGALYGLYLALTSTKLATVLFAIFLYQFTAIGVTAGAHRLWSHRAYKAKWPLRLLLLIMHTSAYQTTAIHWARDHRVHHKYGDTNADPYNAKRGFFFAHIGWLLCRKHPDVKKSGKGIDLSDLFSDPMVRFQNQYFVPLTIVACFLIPTLIPVYFWNESWSSAYHVAAVLRWTFTVNSVWLINSAAHLYGSKPYDKNITPVQNLTVAILASGEGWHNYHHTFPWDYKAAELGNYWFNSSTAFIDFMARIGWAYDLKTASPDMIMKRVQRTGDGTHELWGWGDKDMIKEDRDETIILKKKQM